MIGRRNENYIYIKKGSNYKYVRKALNTKDKSIMWVASISANTFNEYSWTKTTNTEKQAAIAVDIKMIELGRQPVNILKPKV